MTVWVIRAGREAERVEVCLRAGVSALGWTQLGDLAGKDKAEIRALLDESLADSPANTLAAWAQGLDSFVSTVGVGDFVIMPYKGEPKVAIGRVDSPYRYRLDLGDEYKHTRDVTWLEPEYDRSLLPADVTKSLTGAVATIQRIKSDAADGEMRLLLGLDEPTEAVHLLLRWSVGDQPLTIQEHREVASKSGSVWWGKIGKPDGRKPIRDNNLQLLRRQLTDGVPTRVYLYRAGEAWRTDLLEITFNEDETDKAITPAYYGSEPHHLWVRLADFAPLEADWPLDNLVLNSDPTKPLRDAVGGQASLFIVRERAGQNTEPITWWVNQGQTYLQERDGGYMWAPKQSKGAGVGPRPYWTTMTEVRPGDRIVHYRNNAIRAVSRATSAAEDAMRPGELPSEAWEQEGWLVRTRYEELAEPIRRDSIAAKWLVPESGPFNATGNVHQGYLFRVSEELGEELARMLSERELTSPGSAVAVDADGPLAELARRTFMEEADLDELIELIRNRRQVIFHGPPGSGKTWVAEALARHLTDNPYDTDDTNNRLELVQFHQSYGYEDFMQGIRPITTDDGRLEYRVLPGILMRFIDQRNWDPELDYVLIIDEINRGNISRIFGELLMLLEYRDKQVRLPYAEPNAARFRLPKNLLIVGTMNTADRSLASIDYALRRRFAFQRLSPVEHGRAPILERWLASQPSVSAAQRAEVLDLFLALNRRVEDLMGAGGEDFQIGHSYFMTPGILTEPGRVRIWRSSIRPLLEEYLANRRERTQLLDELEPQALLAAGQAAEPTDDQIEEE